MKSNKLVITILLPLLVLSFGTNIFTLSKLSQNNISLLGNDTVTLTTDNYDKYIKVHVDTELRGEYRNSKEKKGFLYNTIDYRLKVNGNSSYKYEDVTVTVKLIIKMDGYTWKSNEPNTQSIDEKYDFTILEKGNAENAIHEVCEFEDFCVGYDGVFKDYEIVSVTGKVIKK
jgi:hypothetical protein